LKCDGTRAVTTFRPSAKRTSPFKSAGASVQSSTGSRGVRISGSNAGYTTFRGSVKSTGSPLHSPVSPSLPLPSVTLCHHISTGLYLQQAQAGPHNSTEPAQQLNSVARHLTTCSCLAAATSHTHVSMRAHFIVDCTRLLKRTPVHCTDKRQQRCPGSKIPDHGASISLEVSECAKAFAFCITYTTRLNSGSN